MIIRHSGRPSKACRRTMELQLLTFSLLHCKQIKLWPFIDSLCDQLCYIYNIRTRKEYLECQVLIIPYSKILQSKASFAFQKNSPYEPIFSYYLNEMRESGSLKKVVNIVTGSPQCPHQSGTPIGFDSCLAAFLALFLGLSSGLILICFERVYQRVEGSQQSIMKRSCSNFSGLVALIDKVIYKQQFESLYAVRNRALHLERQLCELSHRNHFLEERLNRCLMKHK